MSADFEEKPAHIHETSTVWERRRRAVRGVVSSSTMRYIGIATRAHSGRTTRRRSL